MWTAGTVLVCALTLLSRSAESFPPIQLLDRAPAGVSRSVEAFVPDHAGTIYLVTASPTFLEARRAVNRCGDTSALQRIASVLVHEEWHVRNGPDEAGAYTAQLTTLTALGAPPGSVLYDDVRRAMQVVAARQRAAAKAAERRAASPPTLVASVAVK